MNTPQDYLDDLEDNSEDARPGSETDFSESYWAIRRERLAKRSASPEPEPERAAETAPKPEPEPAAENPPPQAALARYITEEDERKYHGQNQFYFGNDVQDLLIACWAAHREEFSQLAPLIHPHFMWGMDAMRVAAAMQDYHEEQGIYPGFVATDNYLHEKYSRDKADIYVEAHDYIEKLKKIDTADWEWVKKVTIKFCKERAQIIAIKKAADLVKTNKVPAGGFSEMFDEAARVGDEIGFQDALEVLKEVLPEEEQIVCDVFDAGDVVLIGGGSKTFKSWLLMMLAVAVATGTPWLGLKVNRAKVCLVNFELKKSTLQRRLKSVCRALGVTLASGWLHIKTLRGLPAARLNSALEWLPPQIKATGAKLALLDPIYQINTGKKENEQDAISLLMTGLGTMAKLTGSAVVGCHHFSKGNQSGKDMLDRFSGSGVFGRYVDAAITLTQHEAEGAYIIEARLRAYAEPKSFVVRWKPPLLVRDDKLDPTKFKKRTRNDDGTLYPDSDLLGLVQDRMTVRQWQEVAVDKLGCDKSTFTRRSKKLRENGKVQVVGGMVIIPEL